MSATPLEARTLKSAPSAKGTDDQKDLSSDLSEDVCLPDAPGATARAVAGSLGLGGPTDRIYYLFTISNTRDPLTRRQPRIS